MKDTNKKKKIYRIIGLCFLGVALVTGAVIVSLSSKNSVAETLESGNRYLSDMDYEAAIREYSYVLELDPLNEDALIGLAECYAGLGDMEMAERIYEEELGTSNNVEVWRSQAKILEDRGNYVKAAQLIMKIMEKEDTEENYQWLDTVLEKLIVKQYSYAESDNVVISAGSGEAYTMGSNLLGALGTAENLGEDIKTASLKKAGFLGTPQSVFTTGVNSYIVDSNQKLWIAGSNRSSQCGNNRVELLTTVGWTEETALTGIAKVAGQDSTVFALTKDGTLWLRGANAGYVTGTAWKETWTPVQEGKVLDVQCVGEYVAILTIEGRLYSCRNNYWDQSYVSQKSWSLLADRVINFSLDRNGKVLYMTEEGILKENYNSDAILPKAWECYNSYGYLDGYQPDILVKDFVVSKQGVYLLEESGKLYFATGTGCTKVESVDNLVHIYEGTEGCIGQKEDGGYVLLDNVGEVR